MSLASLTSRRLPAALSGAWLLVLLVILAALVVYPLLMLLIGALSPVSPLSPDFAWSNLSASRFLAVALRPSAQTAMLNSLISCGLGTALALVLGLFFAWMTERTDTPARRLIGAVGLMPLFVPSLVAAVAWSLLGSPRTGLLNLVLNAADVPFRINMYSMSGIVFVLGVYYAPYVYLFTAAALRNMDASLEEAAAISGVGPLRVLLTVTLPVIAPAIASAALLCFVVTLGIWGVPAVLGTQARIETLTTFIYTMMISNPPDFPAAATISFFLIVPTGLALWAQSRFLGRRNSVTMTGRSTRPRRVALGGWRWLTFAVGLVYLLTAVVVPFAALLIIALRRFIFVSSLPALFDLKLYDLSNFRRLFDDPQVPLSIWNSVVVGAATAVGGTALCFLMGYTIARTRLRGRAIVDVVASLPVAIPSLIIGVAYLWAWISVPIGLYGTLAILVFAGLARYLPDALKSITGVLGQVHRELEEASWICGAGRLNTMARIVLPLCRSGVAAAAVLLFVLSIREYGATLLLYNNRTVLMPVMLVHLLEGSTVGLIAAFSVVQIIVLFVVLSAGSLLTRFATEPKVLKQGGSS